MLFNTKFDLVFSIGEACSCSEALRMFGLQHASYPLDWLYGTDFAGRINLLRTKFKRFIEKKDLSKSDMQRSATCAAYYNSYNDITFNHDFLNSLTFDAAYPQVSEKYNRRIARLMSEIDAAQNILMVFLETPETHHPAPDMAANVAEFAKLQKKYPNKKVCLLYIRNEDEFKMAQLSDTVIFAQTNYKKTSDVDYSVKYANLGTILGRVNARGKTRHMFWKNVIRWIPFKNMRHRLRKKHHIKY